MHITLALRKVFLILACVTFSACTGGENLTLPENNQSTHSEVPVVEVQGLLKSYGYSPGQESGDYGDKTKQAVASFQTDAALTISGNIDAELLYAMGLPFGQTNISAKILVIDQSSSELSKRLQSTSRQDLPDFISYLERNDRRQIDLVFNRPKSIVYIVYEPLEAGQTIVTYASNVLHGKRNKWSQEYVYRVGENDSTFPLIIINEFETSNAMYLVHELRIGQRRLAQRYTRAR